MWPIKCFTLPATAVFLSLYSGTTSAASIQTKLLTATPVGNLIMDGSLTVSYDTGNMYSTTGISSQSSKSGYALTLPPGRALYSPFISGTSCIAISFGSNSSADVYLTTKSNLQTMLSGGYMDQTKANALRGGRWNGVQAFSASLAVNVSQTYVLIMVNTVVDDGYLLPEMEITYRFGAYSNSSSVCGGSSSGNVPTSDALVPELNPSASILPTFMEDFQLPPAARRPSAIIENSTCISYQLLAQSRKNLPSLELRVFLKDSNTSTGWMTAGFPTIPTEYQSYPSAGPECHQTLGISGPQAVVNANDAGMGISTLPTKDQACQAYVNGLNSTAKYVLWAENSASSSLADFVLRVTARGQGNCSSVTFLDPSDNAYIGDSNNYVDIYDPSFPPPPSQLPKAPPGTFRFPGPAQAPLSLSG